MTLTEIADLARVLRSGFPEAFTSYRNCHEVACGAEIEKGGPFVADVLQSLRWAEERCRRWESEWRELIRGVQAALPETWRACRSLDAALEWRTATLDLNAITDDLRRVEGDAIRANNPSRPAASDQMVIMSASEAGRYVGVTDRTIRDWIKFQGLNAENIGGYKYRFSLAELDAKRDSRQKRQKNTSGT
ncbi:MAG: excisionase family DNA-binding protein [Planctomycetaceae bacterium]|nr:excisionase family DNA-binding protein [Planctomycetaceae bacterium]